MCLILSSISKIILPIIYDGVSDHNLVFLRFSMFEVMAMFFSVFRCGQHVFSPPLHMCIYLHCNWCNIFSYSPIYWRKRHIRICFHMDICPPPTELVGAMGMGLSVRHTFWFLRISGQIAEGIFIKIGGYINFGTLRIWSTFVFSATFWCVLASDWWSSFHTFAMKILTWFGSNFMSQLIMGIPRPD